MIKYKKRVHLKCFDYKGCYRYSITLCTYNKQAFFRDEKLANWLIETLKKKSRVFGFKVWAYCFMPNHLHLLIEGENDNSDLMKFISDYKQYTSYYYKEQSKKKLWQTNFYEHILRKEEQTTKVANYIFNNPVRKELVRDFMEYQFLGSFEFDISKMTM